MHNLIAKFLFCLFLIIILPNPSSAQTSQELPAEAIDIRIIDEQGNEINASTEDVRTRLLRGEPVHFDGSLPDGEREIKAEWITEALNNKKPVDIGNAIIIDDLDLRVGKRVSIDSKKLNNVLEQERINLLRDEDEAGVKNVYLVSSPIRIVNSILRGKLLAGREEERSDAVVFLGKTNFRKTEFLGEINNFKWATFSQRADFEGATFSKEADFTGATFSGNADFRGAQFKEADFGEAQFKEAYFQEAQFKEWAYFGGAHFKKVDFRGAQFKEEAYFGEAQFKGRADFVRAQFKKVDFARAQFKKAYFARAQFKEEADFGEAQFKEAYFEGAQFKEANFEWSQFEEAYFQEAQFKEADFVGAQFEKAYFGEAQFKGRADFGEAQFKQLAYFPGAHFKKVDFRGAQFKEAYFPGAIFEGEAHQTNFVNAAFQGDAIFEEAIFKGGAYFSGANFLGDVNLRKASYPTIRISWSQLKGHLDSPLIELKDTLEKVKELAREEDKTVTVLLQEKQYKREKRNLNKENLVDWQEVYLKLIKDFEDIGDRKSAEDVFYYYRKERPKFKMEHLGVVSAGLAQLPPGLVFPHNLTENIRYDKEKKSLGFDRAMAEDEKDELQKLSNEPQYKEAVERLFQKSQSLPEYIVRHGWWEKTKWGGEYIVLGLTCGYGVKPERPIFCGIALIILFSLIYFSRKTSLDYEVREKGKKEGRHKNIHFSKMPWYRRLGNCFYFSVSSFATVGFGRISPRGYFKVAAIIECIFGWLTMALFLVTLANVWLR